MKGSLKKSVQTQSYLNPLYFSSFREDFHYNKHPLPTTQEKILHMDITIHALHPAQVSPGDQDVFRCLWVMGGWLRNMELSPVQTKDLSMPDLALALSPNIINIEAFPPCKHDNRFLTFDSFSTHKMETIYFLCFNNQQLNYRVDFYHAVAYPVIKLMKGEKLSYLVKLLLYAII